MNCSSNYQFTTRLQVNNTQLEVISETHVLGTIVRSDLSWHSNTRYLVKRGYARMTILRNLYKFNIPEEDLVQIYCMYIRSVLEYNSSVWFSSITQEENNDKLGLSCAKLSCQLGFCYTVINICCLILINMK